MRNHYEGMNFMFLLGYFILRSLLHVALQAPSLLVLHLSIQQVKCLSLTFIINLLVFPSAYFPDIS